MGPAVVEGRLAPASLWATTLNSYSSPSLRSSTLNLVVSTSLLLHLRVTAGKQLSCRYNQFADLKVFVSVTTTEKTG